MNRSTMAHLPPAAPALAPLVVALLAAGCGQKTAELKFETATVDRGRIVSRVTATGTLSALVTVQVGSQVSGRVAELFVDFNSQVTKGQVIARIDPQLFEAALEQAKANAVAAQGELAKAQVQAADAQRQAERTRSLAEQKLVAQAEQETAMANANAARAGVDVASGHLAQSRAALNQAKVNLDYTSIHSPINGVVISRSVDVGQTVAASLQAPTLFVIAEDLAKMQVDTSVAEADVGKLQPGMSATFVVDAFPSERFTGTVRQIRNAPQTVQNVVTYDAVIDVANPDLKLRPGMTANVTFVSAEHDDVLRVPNAAIRFRPPPELYARSQGGGEGAGGVRRGGRDGGSGEVGAWRRRAEGGGSAGTGGAGGGSAPGGMAGAAGGPGRPAEPPDRRRVWVMRGGVPAPVSIRVGLSDGSFTEMVEGDLREGDTVVTDATGGTQPQQPSGGPPGGGGRGMGRVF
ncbi:MAG TPA: efflux RND transporter periplasmic adaptor subunit [Myxococcales bacterium]|nr:efflux RND transporter periplasmic adaptor subunit [Myxococcales bacterium]